MTCEHCGETYTDPNQHVRACPNQDPIAIAHTILNGGEYVDAQAEIVARAYLEAVA